MKFKSEMKQKVTLLAIFNLVIFLILNLSFVTLAYISVHVKSNTKSNMDIRLLFGRLDESVAPVGDWGTDTNPYLISESRHLHNLYVLQNRSQTNLITQNSVFQVSDVYGKPNFIGGSTTSSLEEIVSIGSEQYPFVATFRGVRSDNPSDYITLPTGEKSDTSVLGNIRVNALDSQTDIGLFGNVGPTIAPEDGTIGFINTLLLYNIEVNTSSLGGYNPSHKHFVTSAPYETNHIGILVGHAQYTKIQDISVYYSGPNGNPTIKAFNVHSLAGVSPVAKYATSTGIVGYYEELVISEGDLPVTSNGVITEIGGAGAGLGLGVVYSNDLWEFMKEKTPVGPNPSEDEYGLQETFGPELYGQNNNDETYFQIGVFTFAHSMQVTKDDSLAKLWKQPNDNKWSISTSGTYSNAQITQPVTANRYTLTQITNTQMLNQTTQQTTHRLNATLSNASVYRYMITVDATVSGVSKTFALIRNGATAAYKEINTSNFIIPTSELEYYTFDNYYGQQDNPLVPPYGSDGKELIDKRSESLQFNQNNSTTNIPMQYLGYGKNITKSGIIKEIPRPLRILYQNPGTSTSFMASSTTTGNTEGVRFIPINNSNNTFNVNGTRPNATAYSTYILQRRFKPTTNSSSYMTFSPTTGFSATNGTGSAARIKLWAVNYASPTSQPYNKTIYTPTSNIKTYDSDTNVLYYTGAKNDTNPANKYKYDMRSIISLDWSDNEGNSIEEGNYAVKMASPTSYYYLNNKFWGVNLGLPNPGGTGTINVPDGSIGFTVQGASGGGTNKIFVIVATEPSQDINQEITVSRFGSGTNQQSDRTEVDRFPLPPVPGATTGATIPIVLTDNGVSYNTAYPNLNTLLVAFIFNVPVQTSAITYFLEASQGSANFVYLSSERTSAKDFNPFHDNDVPFPALNGIDYVFNGTDNVLATINNTRYSQSLTSPYFGVTRNPSNLDGADPNLDALIVPVNTAYNFQYAINRAYNPSDQKYYIYITITVSAPAGVTGNSDAIIKNIITNYNYNFAEWSYLDTDNYEFVFSDAVVMKINNKTVDWTIHI